MPICTLYANFQGTNPCKGRTIKRVMGGHNRAGSADSPADVVGFGYNDAASDNSVRCVDVGQVWAVELDPMAADVTSANVDMMVVANGLHKGKGPGDTGLAVGTSTMWPASVPIEHRKHTFSALGRKWVWILCAPHAVT